MEEVKSNLNPWIIGIFVSILLIAGVMAFGPKYIIWQREMRGRAELAEAEWSKKVDIEEARARKESAILDADAEVSRAKGAAEAQSIISTTLNEQYLRYLWIQQVEKGDNRQVIYVPTEVGLPILEAERLGQ